MERGKLEKIRTGSVKAAIDLYAENSFEGSAATRKAQLSNREKSSRRIREVGMARREIRQNQDSKRSAEATKVEAESELNNAKKTVKQLTSMIEESNLKIKSQKQKLEVLTKTQKYQEVMTMKTAEDVKYGEVMRQLELAKQELIKLKLDMATVAEQKLRAEKEIEASNSSNSFYSLCAERIRKEIEEVNEELLLVELARIEALKELGEIEALKEREKDQHLAKREEIQKKISEGVDKIERSKETEAELAVTMFDIQALKNELELEKNMDGISVANGSSMLKAVKEELEAAKKELESLKEGSFQCMSYMDAIRTERKQILEETFRLKKTEERADLKVQSLNSKLLRAKSKLEAASTAERKARSIASNLSLTLEQLKKETEAAKREKLLIAEEKETVEEEIQRAEGEINLADQRLRVAMQELEVVKSSEAAALEKLQSLVVNTIKDRDFASQNKSSITISKFEYEYLRGRAVAAEETAERKIAAAEAWVEALKASEKELLLNIDIAEKEIMKMREMEEQQIGAMEKETIDGEFEEWSEESETNVEVKNLQERISRRSMKGNSTPSRRAKIRLSGLSASYHTKNRKKTVPVLGRFFDRKRNFKGSTAISSS